MTFMMCGYNLGIVSRKTPCEIRLTGGYYASGGKLNQMYSLLDSMVKWKDNGELYQLVCMKQ